MITAIDIGASKTLIAQFEGTASVINESRFETPHDLSDFLNTLSEELNNLQNLGQLIIGVPGIISKYEEEVLRCGNLPWHNVNLVRILGKQYQCPVTIANDTKLAALAEINYLTPIPPLGLYLTISTGINGGILINGMLPKPLGNSEIGHMVFNTDCGPQFWENFASGKAIAHHFSKPASELTHANDWRWVAEQISTGLSCLIPILQPNVIIFGGGAGLHIEKYKKPLVESLRNKLTDYIDIPNIISAHYGHQSVIFGCYYYANHRQTS
jgi:predicted NBD/HSP70 family sugar kinase